MHTGHFVLLTGILKNLKLGKYPFAYVSRILLGRPGRR
jgi:hypothetical protein